MSGKIRGGFLATSSGKSSAQRFTNASAASNAINTQLLQRQDFDPGIIGNV